MVHFSDEVRIVLYSSRFEETQKFYRDVLGLVPVKEWDHGEGRRGIVFQLGHTYLEVLQTPSEPKPGDFYIYTKVESIDELWDDLRVQAQVVEPIQSQTWNHRNFTILDPNGYQLKFFSEF
jgi:catechol 2,3-dioxygenase-like lactoylglutathione lyase family enzyme